MKNRLGLFENPFAGMQGEEPLSAEAKKTALALACESSVLLKNDDMLPLKPERKVFWGRTLCGVKGIAEQMGNFRPL